MRYSISSGMGPCYYNPRGGGPGTTKAGFVNGSGPTVEAPKRHADLDKQLLAATAAGCQASVDRHQLADLVRPLLPLDRPTYESVRASLLHWSQQPDARHVRWSDPDTKTFVWRLANPHRLDAPNEIATFSARIRELATGDAAPPSADPGARPPAARVEPPAHTAQSAASAVARGAAFGRT